LNPSHFISNFPFQRHGSSHNLRKGRTPSQRAIAAIQSPGPSQKRKRKLSSTQVPRGSKRNRRSPLYAEGSDDKPFEGLVEGLTALGYSPDFEITVRVLFST
jgi:hypothetical protein